MKKVSHVINKFLILLLLGSSFSGFLPAMAYAQEKEQSDTQVEVFKTETETAKFLGSETQTNDLTTENVSADIPVTTEATSMEEQVDELLATEVENGESTPIEIERIAPETSKIVDSAAEEVVETEDSAKEEAEKASVPVQILGVNDFHGALATTGSAYLASGTYRNTGTAARLATHLDQAETAFEGDTIRIQAGDLVGASPANSDLLQDEPTMKVFNRMNFTLGTLGNHEFDEGLDEFSRILNGLAPAPGQFNEITQNYSREQSKMEIVVANVVEKDSRQIPNGFRPYAIREVSQGGKTVKVGFIGVVTTEFPNLVLAAHHKNFDVLDEAETIAKYSKELVDNGINAIVVIGHVAATSDGDEAQGEAAKVMKKVATINPNHSVDAFFAGHNHQYTNGLVDQTRVVQATSQGKAYIDLQGELDVETGDFVEIPSAVVKPVTNDVSENIEIKGIVDEADALVETVTSAKIATAKEPGNISRGINDHQESVLGNLVTDAQLEMANNQVNQGDNPIKVDFAMTNNGGIRADLEVNDKKEITWGAAQKVQPFGNILQIVAITGQDIKEALNQQFVGSYFLQIAGLSYTYSLNAETGKKKIETIKTAEGKNLDLAKTYHIVINDFLFGGGDGFGAFTKSTLIEAIDTDTSTFVNYFKLKSALKEEIVAPELGRKQLVEENNSASLPLQILGINDFHGALATTGTAYLGDQTYRNAGTAAKLTTQLNMAETAFKEATKTGHTLRIQAGDMVGASPANSSLLQDEPTIRVLNRMNVTIGTLGNHEFDQGLGEFKRILGGVAPAAGDPYYNTITHEYVQREKSKMEIVVGNVVNKSDGEIAAGFKPYTVETIDMNGEQVNIGFIGVVTTEFPNLVLKKHHEDFDVLDEAETIVKYAKELREKGVNAIVVLGHVAATSKGDVAEGDAANIMEKVAQLDSEHSVDAFFAGHNHQYTNGLVKETRIVQATSQGKAFVDLQGDIDPVTQDFVATPEATIRPVTEETVSDEEVALIVNEATELVKQVTEEKIAVAATAETILRAVDENNESVLGNLITDAQLEMANNQLNHGKTPLKVDFALTNNGGIRADLEIGKDRSITWGAAQKVQPFGNILQVVSLKGKDIIDALNQQFGGKYFLQVAGLNYDYTKVTSENAEPSYTVTAVRLNNGEELNPQQTYNVVINDFLFGGGDGFSAFTKGKLVEAIDTDTNTFVNYFKGKYAFGEEIKQPERGRKNLVSDEVTPEPTPEVTEKELIAGTTIKPITVGDTQIIGETLPNVVVSLATKETRMLRMTQATKEVTADNAGRFVLEIGDAAAKPGTELTVTFTAPNQVSTSMTMVVQEKGTTPEPEEAITEADIIKATKIDPIYEGDQTLTGVTLANSQVEIAVQELKRARNVTGVVADEKGKFSLTTEGFNLQKDDQVVLLVTATNGVKAEVRTTVLAKDEKPKPTPIPNPEPTPNPAPTPEPTLKPTPTPKPTPSPGKGNNLPKSGEKASSLYLIGFILIGGSLAFVTTKRKRKQI